MKVLKLLMAALVSSLGISLFTACGGAKGAGKPSASSLGKIENDEPPILRFIVASDVHIKDSGDEVERQRLAKLFTRSYQLFPILLIPKLTQFALPVISATRVQQNR